MGNKILGKRSRSFYKGFNQKQMDYIRQKFEMLSKEGKLDKQKFIDNYRLNEDIYNKFVNETDFDEEGNVDQYEFICMVHALCSMTIQELGGMFFRILTKNKTDLTEKNLLSFTRVCLEYNAYIEKQKIQEKAISKANANKFAKYDFNKDKKFDESQFVKICLKDEDYKKWMFNMGFITKRQMDFQEDIYDLVDSDIGEEVARHDKQINENVSKIKQGIEHRIEDDQFQVQQTVGDQSAPAPKPWVSTVKNIKVQTQNPQPPNQSLQIEYVFGYRSFDCRNNVKYDSKGRIVYHQAAIGIVLDAKDGKKKQNFITEHHDDITCLDVVDDTVVTGQTGAKPCVVMWQTNKKQDSLIKKMVITEQLKDGISNICLSETKTKLAVVCNDANHRLVIYDVNGLQKKQDDPTSKPKTVIAVGNSSQNIPFDVKFDTSEKFVVLATLRQLLFITFEKGALNANRGIFGNFTVTSALCLQPLKCVVKGQTKNYIISGMGNGSLYFWEKQTCVRAVMGHQGSVSAICARKDIDSFVSGDKTGNIIIWDKQFKIERKLTVPKTNCPSSMIVSLSATRNRDLLVGTKSSDIYTLKLADADFKKAQKLMSGHNDGHLWALALHTEQNFIYTGGEDQRLIKWQYVERRQIEKERKCDYAIRSIDFNGNSKLNEYLLVVGYKNGVVECFNPDTLETLDKRYTTIKNPDEQTLNLVKINRSGAVCAVCYQFPKFKVVLLDLKKKNLEPLGEIILQSKIIALDFDRQTKFIRLNTAKLQYMLYDITDPKKPAQQKKPSFKVIDSFQWATHSLPYSPETQGVYTEGVTQDDIVCCQRSRYHANVFVTGDKYSKIKLFNYPSIKNKIYNKYEGHSNDVTGLQFDTKNRYLVSIGGEEKSVIVWKYEAEEEKNMDYINEVAAKIEKYEKEAEEEEQRQNAKLLQMKAKAQLSEFDAEEAEGEQSLATNQYKGQTINPSDFKQKYNARKDNKVPEQSLSIRHVFGLRNQYLKDEVRNQVKIGYDQDSKSKYVLFPTACLGVKMNVETREQEFYHAHREDVVSFAVDRSGKVMATGQMAEKNPLNPRKKIVCIYVWDVKEKTVLKKLDGFHTIAVVLLSFSPNGKQLFSVGNDDKNSFAIYDWMSGTILHSGPTSRAKVNGIAWKTDQQFMTCGIDHVKFWTGPKSMLGKTNSKFQSMTSCVSSKSIYITGSADGGLYNWLGKMGTKLVEKDKSKKQQDRKQLGHKGKVHCLVFLNDYVYSGGADGLIYEWRTQQNGEIREPSKFFDTRSAFVDMLDLNNDTLIQQEQFGVLSIDFYDKKQFVVGTVGASIIHQSRQKPAVIHQGHYSGELWGLATQKTKSSDSLIVTGGDDRTVRLWDLEGRRQCKRIHFKDRVRGLDWSNDGSKIVIADTRAKLYLYDERLSKLIGDYTGEPHKINKNAQIEPFVEDIKFSPNDQLIAYGSHGQSLKMQIVNVLRDQLKVKAAFSQGSSALLHVDWSMDSSSISINTQAAELLFYTSDGKPISASSLKDQRWATWTRKFGFPVKGIFQGVDFTDVNTVCRDPTSKFIAVGYDDQSIRLFRYPCYIDKQVFKMYEGHSSHVTKIKFTNNYMVSLGGNDRTIIVWNVERPYQKNKEIDEGEQSDGLDDIEQGIDLPNKAITRKPKPKKIQQFILNQQQGDQFMAVKPWLGAIKQPTYKYPKQTADKPNSKLVLEHVHGYRVKDCRQNLFYSDKSTLIYHAAAVLVYHNIDKNQQTLLTDHNDDILSIDYHRRSNQVVTGELGPKPSVCVYRDGALQHIFAGPVKKGVLAVAFSPDGSLVACAGMDEDHHVAVLDVGSKAVITCVKGSRKVITKIVWTSNSTFVTVGIGLYKVWSVDKKSLTGKQGSKKNDKKENFVSAVFDPDSKKVYTGASKGTILVWSGTDARKQISLTRKSNEQKVPTSVVDCMLIQGDLLLAGTKDGLIFVINKNSDEVVKSFQMEKTFLNSDVKSENVGIRAMAIMGKKLAVGTLGSQIYEMQFSDLTSNNPFKQSRNILKCHYSPNNTWTNEVWGLYVRGDLIFTCSDDATVRCWSILNRRLECCASTNFILDKDNNRIQLEKDPKTNDYSEASKSRAVCLSPDGNQLVVGSKNGTVRVYKFSEKDKLLKPRLAFRHAKQWISDIKFGYNTLVIGSHDNAIYVYNYDNGEITRKYAPLKKHSSYITHMDISRDSCFLQSTCGAYQLLFWDLNTGKQLTSGATALRDERWSTWTCNLGWPVQGIYPKCTDGTFINSVDRSNFSVNDTLAKDDAVSPYLLAAGNDNGKVALYNYPCTIKSSAFVEGRGHSSHVTNVRWADDDKRLVSVGGEDQCVMIWRVEKKK